MKSMNTNYNPHLLKLDNFDEEVFKHSLIWLQDNYISKMICAPETSFEEKKLWFNHLKDNRNYKCWAIKYNSRPIGVCGIKNISRNLTSEGEYFGYIGDAEYRGKGLGSSLMRNILSKAEELQIDYIYLKVLKNNFPAIAVYEKTGFSKVKEDDRMIFMAQKIKKQ